MKFLFVYSVITMVMTSLVSCNNTSSKSNQKNIDSTSVDISKDSIIEDSISVRGDLEVFGAESPSGTEVQSEGFGRCLESGCYCKEFKGRGQTCRNCGHAYKRHY